MRHPGEVVTDADQVRRLVARQFPQWAALPVTPVPPTGTDHLLYRLGDHLVARMPRIGWAVGQTARDSRWLPVLAPHLPLPVPAPVAVGEPGEDFPWPWSVVPWLAGENPTADNCDMRAVAIQLAEFTTALRGIDPTDGPRKTGTERGVPLAARDELTRAAIADLGDRVDGPRVTAAWDRALSAPAWAPPPAWIHGDLQATNLLVHRRALSAVIDFGGLGVGDPAVDLMPAWDVFTGRSRAAFRDALGCDDGMWERGRGWVLSTSLVGLEYYWDRVPAFAADGRRKIAEIVNDLA